MQTVQTIRCPNCGSLAERHHLSNNRSIRTQCEVCDYFMLTCSESGRVLESYAPGVYGYQLKHSYLIPIEASLVDSISL